MSSSDNNEYRGHERSGSDESVPAQAEDIAPIFRNEKSEGATPRPTELTPSIHHLAMMIARMQGVGLTAEDRNALEQLIATLAELLG